MSNDLVDLMGWIRVDKRKCFLKAKESVCQCCLCTQTTSTDAALTLCLLTPTLSPDPAFRLSLKPYQILESVTTFQLNSTY